MGLIAGALQALPLVSAAAAGLPPLLQGRPLEALASGGLAYAGGRFLGGLPGKPGFYGQNMPGTGKTVVGVAEKAGRRFGLSPSQVLGLTALGTGAAVLPQLARGLGAGTVRAAGSILNPAASTAAALRGGIPGGPAAYDLTGLPPGMDPTFGYGMPYGTPAQMLDPRGIAAGARLGAELMADTQLKIQRRQNEEIFRAAEARSKTEMMRNLAAANIRQNIATGAQQLLGAQQSAQRMGETAASQAGSALTQQYQYQ